LQDFIEGPPMPDIKPERLAKNTWMIFAKEGFPTQSNQGMMANIVFVVTPKGVVVLDSGGSWQIGQMALRMIKTVTPLPVIAVFNSHYHGDHWLGNHAFVEAYGKDLPIYALPFTQQQIAGAEGNLWRSLMERWTNQATLGTKVFAPNRTVEHGQVLNIGGMDFKMHFYGKAHCSSDLSIQIMGEGLTHVGDIAMDNRIANMDDGTYVGSFAYCKALAAQAGDQLWLPGHGQPARDLLARYTRFLAGIWEPCLQAVKDNQTEAQARALVLADPRVAERAATMQGFANNIGKYISLAYLEAEKEAF
jgi:glyoxylase-like metal-dependent hydrolase (beta-lactamase superfamily II)